MSIEARLAESDKARRARFTVLDVSALTHDEREALENDVQGIEDEENIGREQAERLLLKRIGGQEALGRYVRCIV